MLSDGQRIRVAEIDAPEIYQPFGTQARDVMCSMVCGKPSDVEPLGRSYDRLVGLIGVGGLDTSEAMVAAVAAWDYARYDRDPAMPGLEAAARRQGRWLWADPQAIPPWEWRRNHRQSWMTKSGW
ncbi:thermonuclease family protein [Methylobacterium sp. 092160098-2]|uniref:thermonuclease family protein n=1 Tax=Methylobacterium sp. 092160098-2 TaxID=3025129 RepID=UPI002381C770|nr:thermonuclease family protein [Methylobacterium sp. 092160098-2]MDE4915915.1 thermonuclease family protein [Methylobacterium sp. 092160098-2]